MRKKVTSKFQTTQKNTPDTHSHTQKEKITAGEI